MVLNLISEMKKRCPAKEEKKICIEIIESLEPHQIIIRLGFYFPQSYLMERLRPY
jgi:hypothetical protein